MLWHLCQWQDFSLNKSNPRQASGAIEEGLEMRPAQPNVVRIDAQKDVDPFRASSREQPRWRTLT